MSSRIYSNDIDYSKPKFKINKIINKFIISLGVKLTNRVKVFYRWDLKRQPNHKTKTFITVDYEPSKREWYLGFIENGIPYYGTIDDITGRVNLAI